MRASEFWFFRINYLCTIQIQDGNGIKTGYAFDWINLKSCVQIEISFRFLQ